MQPDAGATAVNCYREFKNSHAPIFVLHMASVRAAIPREDVSIAMRTGRGE